MTDSFNETFIQQVNQNLGIAHKICRIYFMDSNDRDDALQEMMYQLHRSYGSFDGRSKFSTWMYSVCLNTALTYRRRDRRKKHEVLTRAHHQIADAAPSNQEESIHLLYEVIAALPALNKAIILLYLEDLSYDEIAEITGLSKSNVGVRLVRIKKSLETEMKKRIEDVNF